jgi:hypothetical protein
VLNRHNVWRGPFSPDFNTFPSVSAGARAQAIDFG